MTDVRDEQRRQPLWATSLGEVPRQEDVVVHRVETVVDDPEPRPDEPRPRESVPGARPALVLTTVAIVLAMLLCYADDGSPLPTRDVASGWGSVTMRCDTARLGDADRSVELFTCHATNGGELPAGRFRSPDYSWNSDITRRRADATDMRISSAGVLHGWATYSRAGFG